jgi:hypothetical protein
VDKSGEPDKDHLLTKKGDVIVYKPDGWNWGIEELNNPEWRIIRVPNMTEEHASSLCSQELSTDRNHTILRKRGMGIDLDNLDKLSSGNVLSMNGLMRSNNFKFNRHGKNYDSQVSLNHILSTQFVKPAIQDPAIIGPNNIIGPSN